MISDLKRRSVISSTDVGSILGVGFKSPGDVVLEKLGITEPTPDCLMFRAGKYLEAFIDAEYRERRGVETLGDGETTYAHPEIPWLVATPDRLVEPSGLAEFKTVSPWRAHEWALEIEEPRIPDGYFWQITVQMAVMCRDWCDVGALIGTDQLRIYRFHRDMELEIMLIEYLREFREKYILGKQIPDDYESPDWAHHFLTLNPLMIVQEEQQPTTDEEDEIMKRLCMVARNDKKITAAKTDARNRLLRGMAERGCNRIAGPNGSASISKKGVLTFKSKGE